MAMTKEAYEAKIRNSPLFSLDPKLSPSAYDRERYRLIEWVYEYLLLVDPSRIDFGVEIVETVTRCIVRFDAKKGDFLHYINRSFKLAKSSAESKYSPGGIHIPDEKRRNLAKYLKLTVGSTAVLDLKAVQTLADELGCDPGQLIKELQELQNIRVVDSTYINNDGDESSLFAFLSDETTAETALLNLASAEEVLHTIEKAFLARQERQKRLLSSLLTAKIFAVLSDESDLLSFAETLSFFDRDIYEQCCQRQSAPTAREIAEEFNRSEQSVSRTYKEFITFLASLYDR